MWIQKDINITTHTWFFIFKTQYSICVEVEMIYKDLIRNCTNFVNMKVVVKTLKGAEV